jgi:hypothetical protein
LLYEIERSLGLLNNPNHLDDGLLTIGTKLLNQLTRAQPIVLDDGIRDLKTQIKDVLYQYEPNP